MKVWYRAVCDKCGESAKVMVTNPARTHQYLGHVSVEIQEWLFKHDGCELRIIHRDDQLDDLWAAGFKPVKKGEPGHEIGLCVRKQATEMARCPRCEAYYMQYPLVEVDDGARGKRQVHQLSSNVSSSPIKCAFGGGVFQDENWCCETMGLLRTIAEAKGYHYRDDMWSACIGVIRIPENSLADDDGDDDADLVQGYVVMTWYKSRGATGNALVVNDDQDVKVLDFATADLIINTYADGKQ